MSTFKNTDGKSVLLKMVKGIQDNKAYLGEVDGLIGDGDHGMNMNKGFTVFETRFADKEIGFTEGLDELGMILLNEIGGSMGPIYGTILMDMAEVGDTLSPSVDALKDGINSGISFKDALENMKAAADKGRDSTKDMVAKFGRSSRLGERSRGVLDAGATSCCIILNSMADGIIELLS